MDLRKPVDLRIVSTDARRQPSKNRTGLFVALTAGAGALCGVAALLGIGPFGAVHASANYARNIQTPAQPIEARALFPSVPPVTKIVNVNDPPRRSPEAAPRPEPPSPGSDDHHPHPSPSPGGEPGDD